MVLPLFVPGGVELAVVFLVAALLFGLPLALVASYVTLSRARRGDAVTEADIEELQDQLADIQEALDEVREAKDEE